MRRFLPLALFTLSISLVPGVSFAQEFSRWALEETLPDPPGWTTPTPAAAAPAASARPGFVESESLDMIVGQAQIDLNSAYDHESAARAGFADFRERQGRAGAGSTGARLGQAEGLSEYVRGLQAADAIYVDVIERLRPFQTTEGQPEDPMIVEARARVEELEADISLADAACYANPANCRPPNPDHVVYADEIVSMLEILDGKSGLASLDPAEVLRTAQLLHDRANLAIRIARLAGQQLLLDGTTRREPSGRPAPLPIPDVGGTRTSSAGTYKPSSPYR